MLPQNGHFGFAILGVTNLFLATGKARRLIATQKSNPLKTREFIVMMSVAWSIKRTDNIPR